MDERLLDVLLHFPDSLEPAREIGDAAGDEVMCDVFLTHAHLDFEDVDDLVHAKDPGKGSGCAIPETGGEPRVGRLGQRDRAGDGAPALIQVGSIGNGVRSVRDVSKAMQRKSMVVGRPR